ncbi:MAG: sodium:alanine symporter family protein [Phycisphaerales bacterium]|nr:sodium:alanine symporter family protein [Phycisphaerales bacterium]
MNPLQAFLDLYNRYVPTFVDEILWGQHTFVVLLGVGLLFTIWSKFIQFRALTHGVSVIRGKYDDKNDPGAINHFQALSAALSATVGLGNIGGVAVAVAVGGPGAVFWMWVVGFLGMAIKSVEVTLAMLYRDTSDPDNPHGGAMWVIKRGFGDRVGGAAKPIAWIIGAIFCVTLLISTVTGGNMFQVWNVANITNQYFGIPQIATGIVLASLTAMVIIGGIKRIGAVAGKLVPFMCGMYIIAGIVVLFMQGKNVPSMLLFIVQDAFSPTEAGGAFLGASAWFGLTTGLRRALFSNEAGQGSSPIAHSAAKTDEPVREGVVAGLEPFVDTCMVCTLTALVILSTNTWNREAEGEYAGDLSLIRAVSPVLDDDDQPVLDDAGEAKTQLEWTVQASPRLDQIPVLPAPDAWLPGNRLFLLAEVPNNQNKSTHQNRIRIGGEIKKATEDDFSEAPADLKPKQARLHRELKESLEAAGIKTDDLYVSWSSLTLNPKDWSEPVTPDGTEVRLVSTGIYRDLVGASLTGNAFDRAIPGLGKWLVTLTCWLFALSTMISWSYYGEQGVVFLFGTWAVLTYKVIFCLLAVVASIPAFIKTDAQLGVLADLGTGVMLLANVPIIVAMGYQAMRAFKDYFGRMARGEMEGPHKAPPLEDVMEGKDVE